MTAPCAISRSNPVARCSASIIGSRPNIRFQRLSRMCSRRLRSSSRVGWVRTFDASAIAIAGDSAGANLALAAMIARRDAGKHRLSAARVVLRLLRARFFDTQLCESWAAETSADHRPMQWYWANFLGARARTPSALRRLRAETCRDCRPSTCRRPASIPCATIRSHWQRGSPTRDRVSLRSLSRSRAWLPSHDPGTRCRAPDDRRGRTLCCPLPQR